ncbi:hypothetical protein C817_05132 [Dorea sp. 5-2]|nr:hypothetical protein C817_05132 [Dorea sp. 5-2]
MIIVEDLYKTFGELQVLKGINCHIKKGEIVSIIGPSGTGKSTFLRCLNYLERPEKGTIIMDGCKIKARSCTKKDIYELRQKTAMIFQNYSLFYNKTVEENIMLPLLTVQKKKKQEAAVISENILRQIGLPDKKRSYPSSLSGGQQQRVGIGRAMAMKKEIMLFDEPTSALDPALRGEVLDLIRVLAETRNTTMIIVTHEIAFAEKISDRIIYMDQGRIMEEGPAWQILSEPKEGRTKEFLKNYIDYQDSSSRRNSVPFSAK